MPASIPRVAALLSVLAAPSALALPLDLPFLPAGSRTDLDGKLEFLDVERADSREADIGIVATTDPNLLDGAHYGRCVEVEDL